MRMGRMLSSIISIFILQTALAIPIDAAHAHDESIGFLAYQIEKHKNQKFDPHDPSFSKLHSLYAKAAVNDLMAGIFKDIRNFVCTNDQNAANRLSIIRNSLGQFEHDEAPILCAYKPDIRDRMFGKRLIAERPNALFLFTLHLDIGVHCPLVIDSANQPAHIVTDRVEYLNSLDRFIHGGAKDSENLDTIWTMLALSRTKLAGKCLEESMQRVLVDKAINTRGNENQADPMCDSHIKRIRLLISINKELLSKDLKFADFLVKHSSDKLLLEIFWYEFINQKDSAKNLLRDIFAILRKMHQSGNTAKAKSDVAQTAGAITYPAVRVLDLKDEFLDELLGKGVYGDPKNWFPPGNEIMPEKTKERTK